MTLDKPQDNIFLTAQPAPQIELAVLNMDGNSVWGCGMEFAVGCLLGPHLEGLSII